MACTIDAEVGGEDANSYLTIAEADTYFESHAYAAVWEDGDDDTKCRALVTATRQLDTSFEWVGTVASSTQALLWPRDDAYGPNGYLHTTDEIPYNIQAATAELAQQLLESNRQADSDTETEGIQRLRLGAGLEIYFKSSVTAKPIPDVVATLVGGYGVQKAAGGAGGALTMLRG
jgi:hypothetical protein